LDSGKLHLDFAGDAAYTVLLVVSDDYLWFPIWENGCFWKNDFAAFDSGVTGQ